MSRKSNRKVHKVLAYMLALVLLITAVPVAVSEASDYTPPQTFVDQAANYLTEWQAKGNNGKTTLFIGDSTMSPQIWRNFYEYYEGKDVLRAGIGSSRTDDWKVLATTYLANTSPKNLVIHLGGNDIGGTSYSNGVKKTPQETYESVVSLFETLRTIESLKDTKFYYFGIKTRADEAAAAKITETNTLIKAWCAENSWVTFADTSAVVASDLYDKVHINMESYQKMYDALAKTGIQIEDAKKNMDIYLIAGASNAAGWTSYVEDELADMDSRYVEGFENIYHSGAVATVGQLDTTLREFEVSEVKAGLGTELVDEEGNTSYAIGPEIGMADALSSRYNKETGQYAGFIKYGIGASSLLKDPGNDAFETWTSPTHMEKLGTGVTDGTGMGVLYENFLDEVETRLAEYEAAGFNPIIKGMYWIQGGADRRREAEYIDAFEDFAADLRKDLTTIAGHDLSDMPIMIGENSETFYAYKPVTINANREFQAMQNMLPSLVSNTYIIDSSGFALTEEDPNNPVPEDENSQEYADYIGKIVGSDRAHWNTEDCITIGKMVGDQILEWDEVATGDINADTKVDKTDLSKLRNTLVRNGDGSSQIITPDVYVNYTGGQVANDGDESIKVGTYKLNAEKSSTAFEEKTDVSYTASRNGDVNGAIITNHGAGPYTVVKDYEFGKEDFTISTWFNLPEGATLSGGGGSYILGNDQPDGKTGFSATLKDGSLRFKLLNTSSRQLRQIEGSALGFTVNRNQWYNIVISRENRVINVYFDGILLFTESIPEGYDFGTRDIGLGAYVGYGGTYQSADMYFDDLQVYRTALSASQVKAIAETEVLIPERNDVNSDEAFNVKDLVDLKIAAANYTGTTPFDVDAADAVVNYNNSTVANSGTNSSITAGAYVLNAEKNSTSFEPATSVQYGAGVDGTENGAIITNNLNGAYTVLDNLNLGKDDFAVSTWFNVPVGDKQISTGNGTYLVGTTRADDTTNGFRVTLRRDKDTGEVKLAYKAGTNSQEYHVLANFDYGEWHHIAVSRIGNALFLYYDGELAQIQIIGEDLDFGDSKIAFGAYVGETWKYTDSDIMYDEVRFYQEEVTVAHVREIFALEDVSGGDDGGDDSGDVGGDTGDDTTDTLAAKVKVTFDGGTVANTGSDTGIKVGTYALDGTTGFKAAETVTYAAGRDGSSNGAIVTNHLNGPYTVVGDYNFGTNDFTVSTWFNFTDASVIKNASSGYLFGTNHPDTGNGFSVVLKKSSNGNYQIRFRGAGAGAQFSEDAAGVLPTPTSNTWYNVTMSRVGEMLNIYFDGTKVFTYSVGTYNFGTSDLAFGAYFGKTYYYDENTRFDDIQVFDTGLTAAQIKETIMGIEPAKVSVNFNGGTVANSGTDTTATAAAYVMDAATTSATTFNSAGTVTYTTGRDRSENGAIITHHQTGPYTVIKNCSLGTDNFTISTWFNIEKASILGNNAGGYLFGTVHPDSGEGFSVVLKKSSNGNYQIRVRGAGKGASISTDAADVLPAIESNTWYNVTISRVGETLYVYFNGSKVLTYSVSTYNFGAKDIAFGAQFGKSYNNTNIYYDDIEVYGVGLSESQVQKLYAMNK